MTLALLLLPVLISPTARTKPLEPLPQTRTVSEVLQGKTPFVGPQPVENPNQPAWLASADEPEWAPSQPFVKKLQSVTLILLVMTAFIGITLKGVQKYFPGVLAQAVAPKPGSLMNVIAKETVAPGFNLCLVEIGPKIMLLGLTEGSISTICELTPEELAKAREATQAPATPSAPQKQPSEVYRDILRHYLSIFPGMGPKRS